MKKIIMLSVLLIPSASFAQSYSIAWSTIDGGGGTSTGGGYSVSGTIGQPDAHSQTMAGGSYSLKGGFWSLIAAPLPAAPVLSITLTTTNTALVSWPSSSPGFTLQHNHDLATTNWLTAPQIVADNGTIKYIIVNLPGGNRFYRLFKP